MCIVDAVEIGGLAHLVGLFGKRNSETLRFRTNISCKIPLLFLDVINMQVCACDALL